MNAVSAGQILSHCWHTAGNAVTIAMHQCAPAIDAISYAGHRLPPDEISYAVCPYSPFPLSLRMVEELLTASGIALTYEAVRRWSVKFGLGITRRIRSTAPEGGDTWHLDEALVTLKRKTRWLWRAVDQHGAALEIPVQRRLYGHAALRLTRKLLKRHGHAPVY